jgi:hypothetical protein
VTVVRRVAVAVAVVVATVATVVVVAGIAVAVRRAVTSWGINTLPSG